MGMTPVVVVVHDIFTIHVPLSHKTLQHNMIILILSSKPSSQVVHSFSSSIGRAQVLLWSIPWPQQEYPSSYHPPTKYSMFHLFLSLKIPKIFWVNWYWPCPSERIHEALPQLFSPSSSKHIFNLNQLFTFKWNVHEHPQMFDYLNQEWQAHYLR